MIRCIVLLVVLLCNAASAQPVLWMSELRAVEGEPLRLRLVAQNEVSLLTFEQVESIFQPFCDTVVASQLLSGSAPSEVVVSISDRPVEFGETNPEAVQFFELFDVIDGRCVWRAF